MKYTPKQTEFIVAAHCEYPGAVEFSREQIMYVCEKYFLKEPQWLIKPANRVGRGMYRLPGEVTAPEVVATPKEKKSAVAVSDALPVPTPAANTVNISTSRYESLVPKKDKNFVKFGVYAPLRTIIQSRQFYPVFISGLSGNGKSFTPEQICAELGREFFEISITKRTSEDDLFGGYRLIDGNTVWFDGPVTQAAERGGVVCLNEIDYGSDEITCLQRVLEGKPFLLKKINKLVTPAPGFNIIATANTKGQGDLAGKFVFTNVLNEAFLERFAVTLEQEYPSAQVETKILKLQLDSRNVSNDVFAENLVKWANTNRETYKNGGCNEIISTRRLVHIVGAYEMFKDKKESVALCLNRFDEETKGALADLWEKIDFVPKAEPIVGNSASPLPPSQFDPSLNNGKSTTF